MATPIPRPTYARNDTDQVTGSDYEGQPMKKSAGVMMDELDFKDGAGASSSGSDIKKKYDDGSDSEHGIATERFENLVLDDSEIHYSRPVENAIDLVTEVLHVDDDTSINPWTFRM